MADQLPIVVIDAGHGGSADVGGSHANDATGPNGLLEKDLTLDMARRVARALDGSVRVILTRDRDVNLSLTARAHLAKENQAAAFVSIHFDGWTDPKVDGTSVWVAPDAGNASHALAQAILTDLLPVTEVPNRGVQRNDFGVIKTDRHDAKTAVCLAEVAFLTNPAQAKRLEDPAYRQRIAEAIAQAVRDSVLAPARARALAAVGVAAAPGGQGLGVATDWFVRRLEDYLTGQRPGVIPLDPGSGGRSVSVDALQKGDLLVSTTLHTTSIGIRYATQGPVSHALVYIGDGEVVEAIGPGVTRRSIQESLADDTLAVAFRYPNMTDAQAQQVRDFLIQQVGKPYNLVGLVDPLEAMIQREECALLPGDWLQRQCMALRVKVPLGTSNDRFFCSQLVLEAYRQAGIPLTQDEPAWHSPDDIAQLGFKQLEYVGHLKAPAPGQPFSLATAAATLGYGVPGGTITDGFYRDLEEKKAITGRSDGRASHLGMDVSTSNQHGGDATDQRRGLPVYATIKPAIDLTDLNAVRAGDGISKLSGLGIKGAGSASLQDVVVHLQPWHGHTDDDRGGVVGLSCVYRYAKPDGSAGMFTLYLEYLHLITNEYLPKDGNGHLISAEEWAKTGKGIGFGPQMREGSHLTAADISGAAPLLVGYLGATPFPHVHIQAAYADGQVDYVKKPRFDPAVMLLDAVMAQAAMPPAAVSHALETFEYDVPGTFPPLMQVKPMGCWATGAAMLVSWKDNVMTYTVEAVMDKAGARWRRIYDDDTGLGIADVGPFAQDAGLVAEPPMSYSVPGVFDLLSRFGPLWVGTSVGLYNHVQVITGLHGDGTPDGTGVWFVDPGDGTTHHETYRDFIGRFEEEARRQMASGPVPIQIIHNR